MPRPQFTLRALLVAMLVVAAFFGGAAWQRRQIERQLRASEENAQRATLSLRQAIGEIEGLRQRLTEGK